jgi:hypothetical protein
MFFQYAKNHQKNTNNHPKKTEKFLKKKNMMYLEENTICLYTLLDDYIIIDIQ